ncbi:MAG: aryl-sulfate sulfotransferase, partial [Lachnospiraceae bacterium]
MKNTALKILLIMTIISGVFLCGLLYLAANKGNGDGQGGSRLKEYQEQYEARAKDSKTLTPNIYRDFSSTENNGELYDTARHTQVYERIEALKKQGGYTQDAPLVIYNPYGTNTLSLYLYFETETPMKASYRISAPGSELPTFSADCYSEERYTVTHEYLLLGLTAEHENRVALTLADEEGNSCVRTFYVSVGSLAGEGKNKLSMKRGVSGEKLSDGLFAQFGNETGGQETVLLYDNDGALRGEIPILSGSCKRFLFFEERMYYNISDTQLAAVDRFGRAERVYTTDGYTIGNDYCIDEGGKKLLVLASKNGEAEKGVNDRVLSVDLISGEVKELLDMGVLLKEYKEACKKNAEGTLEWLNLNSIQVMAKDGILLGAREASAAFKIEDIYGVPMLGYIVGDPLLFEGTGYASYVLTKSDDFVSFFGANTMTYVKEDGMPSGVYALYLFDNHIGGTESRPEL